MGGKRKTAPTAPRLLPPQGKEKKRTPQSAFDGAAGKDVYEPEKIVGKCISKGGVTKYLVKWAGFETKHNTWEPLEHLAGCEDMIVEFNEREKQRVAELDAVAEAKRIEKQAATAKKAAEDAAAATAARLAALASGTPLPAENKSSTESEATKPIKSEGSRRSAPIWEGFDTKGCGPGFACCKLLKATGELCGEMLSIKSGPTTLWNHAMYVHKADYMRFKGKGEPLILTIDPQTRMPLLSPSHRDAIHKAIARWLVKRKRPLSLPEDPEFHDVFKTAMRGAYTPPDHKIVLSNVMMLSALGHENLKAINASLREKGIKPAIAGDIWSDRGVSLLGCTHYHVTDEWTIKEFVLAASPFSERHTADAIRKKTSDACVRCGLSADVASTVFFPVSDNGANMVAGWAEFGRGPCAVHTGQLSVHVFLEHPQIEPTRTKARGIVSHFSFCTGVDGLGALHKCQRECSLPEHHPVKDNNTRW